MGEGEGSGTGIGLHFLVLSEKALKQGVLQAITIFKKPERNDQKYEPYCIICALLGFAAAAVQNQSSASGNSFETRHCFLNAEIFGYRIGNISLKHGTLKNVTCHEKLQNNSPWIPQCE
ncbi:hypothetical protein STEG23_009038, partial [Scotinomys teguina]